MKHSDQIKLLTDIRDGVALPFDGQSFIWNQVDDNPYNSLFTCNFHGDTETLTREQLEKFEQLTGGTHIVLTRDTRCEPLPDPNVSVGESSQLPEVAILPLPKPAVPVETVSEDSGSFRSLRPYIDPYDPYDNGRWIGI